MKRILFGTALVVAAAGLTLAEMRSSITNYGITWAFDQQYECGQYATGDWWVVGPVKITGISPAFDGSHHGWEVNPPLNSGTGFDSRIGGFDASRVPSLPYTASPGQSLIKSVSVDFSNTSCRPCVKEADVLTVVSQVPADNGATVFRPPYVSTDKPMYSVNDLQMELLPSLAAPPLKPTLEQVAKNYARVRPDHKMDYRVRYIHPEDHMPDYGSNLAIQAAEAALRLCLDDHVQDKIPALINYVQNGIDLYHITKLGRRWEANGGQGFGRTLVQIFTAALLDNREMKDFITNAADNVYAPSQAIFFSQQADNGAGKVLYGEFSPYCTREVYWGKLIDPNITGSKHCDDPYGYIDGGYEPGGGYQFCCASQPLKQTAIALHVFPELMELWNDDRVLQYTDRWVNHGAWTQPDPCAPAEASMANYGITFGEDPDNPGDCIRDTDPSDGIGRFPALHGTKANQGSYGSNFANFMWAWYRDSTFTTSMEVPSGSITKNDPAIRVSVPNPCVLPAVFQVRASIPQPVRVTIHDNRGRQVAELVNQGRLYGSLPVIWEGRNTAGGGVYYLVADTGNRTTLHRFVVLD